jgi:anti-anti-sigma regulatory factor
MGTRAMSRPTNRRTRASLPADFTLDSDQTTGHRLRKLALDPRIDELLLDGRAVQEVSSRALGLLVALTRLTAARGAIAVIVDASPELIHQIDRRGLSAVLLPAVPLAPVMELWPQLNEMATVLEPFD